MEPTRPFVGVYLPDIRNRLQSSPILTYIKSMKKQINQGFTLIELMIAILVLAIVIGIGVPSFITQIRNSELTTYTNELVHSLTLARSESVKSLKTVTVASVGGDWSDGWTVTRDGFLVREFNSPPATGSITGANGVDPITFHPMGNVTTAECFDITVTNASNVRSVMVSASGRATTCTVDCATVTADYSACH